MTAAVPGYDKVVLKAPNGAQLCDSLGCARAGTLAEVIVAYGVLSDPGASYHSRQALWPECWGQSYPVCATCWESSRQVVVKYRPGLVVRDLTASATPQPPMGRR